MLTMKSLNFDFFCGKSAGCGNRTRITLLLILTLFFCNPLQAEEINLSAISLIESSNNPRAFNKLDHGGLGSRGLFQISNPLRLDFNRINKKNISANDLFNPKVNTEIASWAFSFYYPIILKKTLRLPVTTENLIVCHNAGCGALKRKSLPTTTQNYIKKYRRLAHA